MNIPQILAAKIASSHASARQLPYFVAICGWADTGKSTLAGELCANLTQMGLGADWLSTDAFLKNRDDRNALGLTGYNASSVDASSMSEAVAKILSRQSFEYHPYDNRTGCKTANPTTLSAQHVIVIEGIHAFHPTIFKALNFRLFIDSDETTLRLMRARANINKRGMNALDSEARIVKEWADYQALTLPLKSQADLVVKVSRDFEYSVQS